MLKQELDGTWWVVPELHPEDTAERRQVSESEAADIIADYKARDERRLAAIERARAPEYAI
jgi:hypothetical protein